MENLRDSSDVQTRMLDGRTFHFFGQATECAITMEKDPSARCHCNTTIKSRHNGSVFTFCSLVRKSKNMARRVVAEIRGIDTVHASLAICCDCLS